MAVDWVCLNGSLLPADEARVPAATQAFLYGVGVFETFRARGGHVYRLDRHYERLERGARTLSMPVPLSAGELAGSVAALVRRAGLDDARLRLTLAAGATDADSLWLITVRGVEEYPESLYAQGVGAIIASVWRNDSSPLARLKSLNYLDNLLARRAALQAGAWDAILLNSQGFVAEGSASNVFVVENGRLVTPRIDDGALPGVTRAAVMDLAAAAGLAVEERQLSASDLVAADELFFTNAVAGVLPLVSLGGSRIASGLPGGVTRRIRRLYQAAAWSGVGD